MYIPFFSQKPKIQKPKIPVYLILGHSNTPLNTLSKKVELGSNQYIITMAKCGYSNYFENKKIYSYLKNQTKLESLQKNITNDPDTAQAFIKKLQNNVLSGEKSTYILHSHNGIPYYDQQINVSSDPSTGFVSALPNNFKSVKRVVIPKSLHDASKSKRKRAVINRIRQASGPVKAANYNKNDQKKLNNLWVSDLIGDKPGIYIVLACRGQNSLGEIRSQNQNQVITAKAQWYKQPGTREGYKLTPAYTNREPFWRLKYPDRTLKRDPTNPKKLVGVGNSTQQGWNVVSGIQNMEEVTSQLKKNPTLRKRAQNLLKRYRPVLLQYGLPVTGAAGLMTLRYLGLI